MGLSHSPKIVTDGLVMYLDAANVKSYPGSGTTWNDLSGNGYDHTITNPTYEIFSGSYCFKQIPNSRQIVDAGTTFTYGSDYTMEAWAAAISDEQTGDWRTLWRTSPNNHPLLIQNNTNTIGYYDNEDGTGFNSYGLNAGTLNLENKWTLYTIVASAGVSTLYINNCSASGSVSLTTDGNEQDAIGTLSSGGQPFGRVAIAKAYNRALTETEIKQNFEALRGRFNL